MMWLFSAVWEDYKNDIFMHKYDMEVLLCNVESFMDTIRTEAQEAPKHIA